MHYYLVAPNRIARIGQDYFTYHSEGKLESGQVVMVQLGNQSALGIVIEPVSKPNFDTKPILRLIESTPLPKSLVELAIWISNYYVSPLAQTLQTILPTGITKKRRISSPPAKTERFVKNRLTPTPEQSKAIQQILRSDQTTTIIHGITGSGKTTVYLELAHKVVSDKKSVIIIVPEIALTSQLLNQFETYFNQIVIVHSKLTEAKKHLIWQKCLTATEPMVIIGARSALFTPLKDLGLIVIDEFHESSLKQDKNPRYYATRVAGKLAALSDAKLVLGSATPPITEYWLSEHKSSSIIDMKSSAQKRSAPKVALIDMTKKANFSKHSFLSNQLLAAITDSLANKEQVLIFHNHRGSAAATICEHCGWLATCPSCNTPLTLHGDKYLIVCHICGYRAPAPTVCPECGSSQISHRGIGTKLIEAELTKQFKSARIQRFDGDSNQDETVDKLYNQLVNGDIDILIGTQVVAKGLNLPNLSTVGIIQADSGLALPDYLAEERNFQLIAQVVGRVGRDQRETKVVVQTYQPTSPSIALGINQDYHAFYNLAIAKRKKLNFPPFCYMLRLKVSYKTESAAIRQAKIMTQKIKQLNPKLVISGPAPAFYEKARGQVHWQLIIKAKRRQELISVIGLVPSSHWQYDIDPLSLL